MKDNPVFSNGPKRVPKNPVFDDFILADKPFSKSLESYLLNHFMLVLYQSKVNCKTHSQYFDSSL